MSECWQVCASGWAVAERESQRESCVSWLLIKEVLFLVFGSVESVPQKFCPLESMQYAYFIKPQIFSPTVLNMWVCQARINEILGARKINHDLRTNQSHHLHIDIK